MQTVEEGQAPPLFSDWGGRKEADILEGNRPEGQDEESNHIILRKEWRKEKCG